MNIFLGQIYTKPGVSFPFSLAFQKWIGNALSERIEATEQFKSDYGADFTLGFRLSAKENIDQPEIHGPTIFRRDKTVEFSVFLPFHLLDYHDPKVAANLIEQMLVAISSIIQQLGLDPKKVIGDIHDLQNEFLDTPSLLDSRK